jgi:cyclohexa-1,5-dienecarbonyl-CoA hydratase
LTPETKLERTTLVRAGSVLHITLNHGRLNIIDFTMMEELKRALDQAEADAAITTLVFSGEGDNFSAGVDIPSHTADKVKTMLEKFHAVIRALASSRKVLVAKVRGNCLGGGAELALMCDIVISTGDARWGFPEIQLACFPPVAAVALAAVVGQKRAADLILTGRTISGEEAAHVGLANESVAGGKLDVAVEERLALLEKLSPAALAVAKRALYAWHSMHFDKGLARAEEIYNNELTGLEDMREGIAAWVEKREPKWKWK